MARGAQGDGVPLKANGMAYACFPTLEKFAQLVGKNDSTDCSIQAQKSVQGKVKVMVHMWGNYQTMAAPSHHDAEIYVIRKEHMWEDWQSIHKMLDPNREVILPSGDASHHRNVDQARQPVTRDLSDEGRDYLCHAMKEEYKVFFR